MTKFNNQFFDENFFLYFEEIDLCKQVIKKNGKIYLDQRIQIKHQGASSVNKMNTLELEKNRQFTLTKECWDKVHLDILRTSQDPTASADVAAVVMQEGLAHVCLLTTAMTHVRQKIEQNVPRKGKAALYGRDKAVRTMMPTSSSFKSDHAPHTYSFVCLLPDQVFLREDFRCSSTTCRFHYGEVCSCCWSGFH